MKAKKQTLRIIRWLLSAVLVFIGLSTTWAWGEVARLAEPDPAAAGPQETALYGIWQPEQARRPGLYRSTDAGQSWQLLSLPAGTVPLTWANDGERLAVATDSLTVVSTDGGESWATTIDDLNVVSLAWGDSDLYLGTRDQGVHRLPPGASTPAPISAGEVDLQAVPVTHLAVARAEAPTGERLFAASANTVYYTDDGGRTWQRSTPVEDWISTLAVVDKDQIYVGGETAGVYRSLDAGQSWQPARKGLGLAPGQMVKVTALRADPAQPGVLYSAVDHVLGSTQAHASAAGAFVSLDGGTSWSPLAGPAFPQAQHASSLVLVPGSPLHVHAVTANGLQAYAPDIAAALTALDSPEPAERAAAARLLGLARAGEAGEALLAALTDPEPAVSLAAGRALGQIADPAMAGPLSVALDHPSSQVRMGAARALGMMGAETAVERLRAMLLEGDGQEVTVAAEALGQIGTPAAVEALMVPLGDLSLTPRRHAAMGALETLGEPAVEALVQRLESPSSHIRRNAAEALGWVGAPSAVEPLQRALQRDRDTEVRARTARALGQIGDPAAQGALLRAAQDDPALRVREQAGQALSQLGELAGREGRAAGWPQNWAPALNRLQPLRWLFLAFSLAGAAWLALGQGPLLPVPLLRRITNS